jgi:hypothetical protein
VPEIELRLRSELQATVNMRGALNPKWPVFIVHLHRGDATSIGPVIGGFGAFIDSRVRKRFVGDSRPPDLDFGAIRSQSCEIARRIRQDPELGRSQHSGLMTNNL